MVVEEEFTTTRDEDSGRGMVVYDTISHNAYGQIRLVMHDGMTFRDHSLPTRQEHTYGLWDIVL